MLFQIPRPHARGAPADQGAQHLRQLGLAGPRRPVGDQALGHLTVLAAHQGRAEPLGQSSDDGPALISFDVGEGVFQKGYPYRGGRCGIDIRLDSAGGVVGLRMFSDLPGPGVDDAAPADDDAGGVPFDPLAQEAGVLHHVAPGGVQELRRGLLAHGPDHALDGDPHEVFKLIVEGPPETVGVGPGLSLGQHQHAAMIGPMGDGRLADLGDQVRLGGLCFLGGLGLGGAIAGGSGSLFGGAFFTGLGQADDAVASLVPEFLPRRGDHPADRDLFALPVPGCAMTPGSGMGGVQQHGDDLVLVDVLRSQGGGNT